MHTPTDVFMVFVESILNDLVYQTDLYGTQKNKTLMPGCMKQFRKLLNR